MRTGKKKKKNGLKQVDTHSEVKDYTSPVVEEASLSNEI